MAGSLAIKADESKILAQCIGESLDLHLEMMTKIRILSFLLISTVLLTTAIPLIPESAETTVPSADDITIATDLKPPHVGEDEHHGFVYLINLYAVKNTTSNLTDGEEESQISEEEPEILGPLASVLLIVEDDEELKNLDDVAKDLEDEGYQVERIIEKNGETKFVDVDMTDLKMKGKMKAELKKIRRKRCLKCKKKGGKGGGGGGYGGGGYGGGGGGYGGSGYGGGGTVGVVPIAVIPISVVPVNGGYSKPSGGNQHYHQPSYGGGGCDICGGGGGGGGGGGRGEAYAQASASASSWGK